MHVLLVVKQHWCIELTIAYRKNQTNCLVLTVGAWWFLILRPHIVWNVWNSKSAEL